MFKTYKLALLALSVIYSTVGMASQESSSPVQEEMMVIEGEGANPDSQETTQMSASEDLEAGE